LILTRLINACLVALAKDKEIIVRTNFDPRYKNIFFYLRGCPGQFVHITTNLTAHWISCKHNEHVRHRGDNRHAHGDSNPDTKKKKQVLSTARPIAQSLTKIIIASANCIDHQKLDWLDSERRTKNTKRAEITFGPSTLWFSSNQVFTLTCSKSTPFFIQLNTVWDPFSNYIITHGIQLAT